MNDSDASSYGPGEVSAPSRESGAQAWLARMGDAYVPEPNTGCWLWMMAVTAKGYGKITIRPRTYRAHRLSYELLRGPVPAGMELDHLCRQRSCVNPDHLQPVTARTNQRRGNSASGVNSRRTRCVHGHPFDNENTAYWTDPKGRVHRSCRACKNPPSAALSSDGPSR